MSNNRNGFLACALAACLLSATSSFAQSVADSAITVAITSKLLAARFSSVTHLKVTTDLGGVVSLTGTTASRREAERAVAIARGTGGVVHVRNGILVQAKAR